MPNWVTNEVRASKEVLDFLNSNESVVDFEKVIKFEAPHDLGSIYFASEEVAKKLIAKEGLDSTKLLIKEKESLKTKLKAFKELSDEGALSESLIAQSILMIENYVVCGFFHHMDFARSQWGTKWNACDSKRVSDTCVRFDTAWSCPQEVLEKLSLKFPKETIAVKYADEDLGYNCGFFTLKNGEICDLQQRDGHTRSENYDKKWVVFAATLKGWSEEMIEEYLKERYE